MLTIRSFWLTETWFLKKYWRSSQQQMSQARTIGMAGCCQRWENTFFLICTSWKWARVGVSDRRGLWLKRKQPLLRMRRTVWRTEYQAWSTDFVFWRRVGKEQEGVLKWWGKVLCSGSICAFLGLVLGQALLVLIAQGTLVLLLHLYPILPSKPTFIVCNITHNHVIYTHRQTNI